VNSQRDDKPEPGGTVHPFPEPAERLTRLTPRQERVLEVIRDSISRRGYPPSMREIGEAAGLASPSSVSHQLGALEVKGYIRRDPNRPRALEVLSPGAAGEPTDHDETGFGDDRPQPSYLPVVRPLAPGGPLHRPQAV
jgi:repressor LexA